jgi:hypothetical protein
MQYNHWWFLNLKWDTWVFVTAMILAIVVLVWTRKSYMWNSKRNPEVQRRVYYPSVLGVLIFTAVLYLGVHWEMWGWYHTIVVWVWWISAIAFLLNLIIHKLAGLAQAAGYQAFVMVMLMLVISFFGWIGSTGWYNNIQANMQHKTPTPSTSSSTSVPSQSPTSSPSPTPKPSPTKACATTWELKTADHGANRWFADGVTTIQNAKTSAQARAAANDWVHKVEYDPALLSGAISYFLHKEVPAAQLTAGKCASTKAKTLASELELKLATSKVTAGNAPSNGTNSGVDNGRVVSATISGITGNTKAVKVVMSDGTIVWIMARCGNPVTQGKAPVPPGKTENQPPPPPHKTPPPKCVPSKIKPPPGFKVDSNCHLFKPPQSKNCMLNGGPGCPPNQATQPVQHNSGQPTGRTTGAPTSAPPTPSSSTTAPGGSSGTSTGTPTGTSTCNPAVGCGTTHTSPPPTNIP